MQTAVDQARKRLLAQLGLRDALLAAAVALAGPALLLILGTDRFPSLLLWVFVAAGVGWALYHWRSDQPSGYSAAQLLDQRWGAQDQIATAYFFRDRLDPQASRQRELAAGSVGGDVGEALPLEWPRVGWAAAALLAATVLLLAVRLSVMPTLSFQPGLAPLLFPSLTHSEPQMLEREELPREEGEEAARLSDAAEEADRTPPGEPPAQPPDATEIPLAIDAQAFEMPEVEGLSLGDELTPDASLDEGPAAGEGAEPESGEAAAPDPSSDWSEESNNLLDRLKDAFENMIESMSLDSPQGSEGEPQSGEGEQEGEASSESGEQAQSDAPGNQASSAEMEGGEQAEGAPEEAAPGQDAGDSEEGGQPGESASASGSAEGSKEIADEAEREAALDALEEFFQERNEEVRGEITVETSEAEQSAVTPYQDVAGSHADRGGAVTRDEIPLVYQRFIQSYFRNLREQEPQK